MSTIDDGGDNNNTTGIPVENDDNNSYTGNDDDGAKVPQGEGYKFFELLLSKIFRSAQLSGFDSFEFLAKFRRQKSRQFCR